MYSSIYISNTCNNTYKIYSSAVSKEVHNYNIIKYQITNKKQTFECYFGLSPG